MLLQSNTVKENLVSNKLDLTIYLKYFIFPVISLISITIIYVLLIMPYLNLKSELDSTRDTKNMQIKNFETKLSVLQNARAQSTELTSYQEKLVKLVPNEDSPAPLVANLDATAAKFNFNKIDENKNIADKTLTEKGNIEVTFNGRTIGALSALNFLSAINTNSEKIINIRDLELFDDRENKYYRVSFVARTIFNKNKVTSSLELPVYDILRDENFINFMKRFSEEN